MKIQLELIEMRFGTKTEYYYLCCPHREVEQR